MFGRKQCSSKPRSFDGRMLGWVCLLCLLASFWSPATHTHARTHSLFSFYSKATSGERGSNDCSQQGRGAGVYGDGYNSDRRTVEPNGYARRQSEDEPLPARRAGARARGRENGTRATFGRIESRMLCGTDSKRAEKFDMTIHSTVPTKLITLEQLFIFCLYSSSAITECTNTTNTTSLAARRSPRIVSCHRGSNTVAANFLP